MTTPKDKVVIEEEALRERVRSAVGTAMAVYVGNYKKHGIELRERLERVATDQILQTFKELAIPLIEKRAREKLIKEIESLVAKNPVQHTFDATGVELCRLIKDTDWQALKGGK